MNAYTSFDRTVYWINAPNTEPRSPLMFFATSSKTPLSPRRKWKRKSRSSSGQMDMNHDDPALRSARRLFEVAYAKSPYRFPIIGYPDIYQAVRREDVLAYYKEKYAPNNLFSWSQEMSTRRTCTARSDPPSPTPKPVLSRPVSFPMNRAQTAPGNGSRRRPSNWVISISAGTSQASGTRTSPCSTSSPPSWAVGAAPDSTGSARDQGVGPLPSTAWVYSPATPVSSA